jgi:RimJ/RimL family protein N-acetyltransferase
MEDVDNVLVGKEVTLRPLREDDLSTRLRMVNTPEVQLTTIGIVIDHNTLEDMQAWYRLTSDDKYSEQWAIEADGKYIGDIDLHSIHVLRGEAWISPMIGDLEYTDDPSYRQEAISLLLSYVFCEKGVERVSIDLPSIDAQGVRILANLGFRTVEEMDLDPLTGVKTMTMELRQPDFHV